VEEELKIGDWVRGIYNGHVFQIDYIKPRMESKTLDYSGKDEPMYLASSLRKLAPEEIKQHLCKDAAIQSVAGMPSEVYERLSAIDKRLTEDRNLMTEIEERLDGRLDILEGEMPEVCESPLTDLGAIAAIASFAPVPECVAAFIRQETEVAEKRKREGDCHPNTKPIRITISRGQDDTHCFTDTCPSDCLSWAEKVLDSMREG